MHCAQTDPLRPENREVLRRLGTVLYLRASPDEIYKRVKHDKTRPLLQGGNPLEKLRELYAQRDRLYRETAHFVIETGRRLSLRSRVAPGTGRRKCPGRSRVVGTARTARPR